MSKMLARSLLVIDIVFFFILIFHSSFKFDISISYENNRKIDIILYLKYAKGKGFADV